MSELPKGIGIKAPHEKAPDFVKGRVSFKVEEFIDYLKENEYLGWVNMDLLESKKGNLYFKLDEYKKENQGNEEIPNHFESEEEKSELPF